MTIDSADGGGDAHDEDDGDRTRANTPPLLTVDDGYRLVGGVGDNLQLF